MLSFEWRCSWSSADRRCSNNIWVINNCTAYLSASYNQRFGGSLKNGQTLLFEAWFNYSYRYLHLELAFSAGVSGFATNCPRCVWGHVLTSRPMYVGPVFGEYSLNVAPSLYSEVGSWWALHILCYGADGAGLRIIYVCFGITCVCFVPRHFTDL